MFFILYFVESQVFNYNYRMNFEELINRKLMFKLIIPLRQTLRLEIFHFFIKYHPFQMARSVWNFL